MVAQHLLFPASAGGRRDEVSFQRSHATFKIYNMGNINLVSTLLLLCAVAASALPQPFSSLVIGSSLDGWRPAATRSQNDTSRSENGGEWEENNRRAVRRGKSQPNQIQIARRRTSLGQAAGVVVKQNSLNLCSFRLFLSASLPYFHDEWRRRWDGPVFGTAKG